jgi:hypothetical protein
MRSFYHKVSQTSEFHTKNNMMISCAAFNGLAEGAYSKVGRNQKLMILVRNIPKNLTKL